MEGEKKFILIAGPCVIEDYPMLETVCGKMKELCEKYDFDYVFKASFDKANRSSQKSFRGPGIERGLEMLAMIKDKFKVKVTSDVHSPDQVLPASKVLDVVQLPAFLARQTDFYAEAGKIGAHLNVKKGQFMSPYEMKTALEKFTSFGGEKIWMTERGTFMGYGNLVVDFRSLDVIKGLGVPYIFDATHSVQLPAAGDGRSLGQRQFIPTLLKAQTAAGADGAFMEVHPNPEAAKSDASTQMALEQMEPLMKMMKAAYEFALENDDP